MAANNGQLIIANAHGQEVGSSFAGIGGLQVGPGGYTVGPWAYGLGAVPWGARDEAPPPRAPDIRRMLQIDGKAQQVFEALTQPIRAARWRVNPGFGDTWIRAWLKNMDPTFEQVIGMIAGASAYARTIFEAVYDTKPDGRITPVRLGYRPPDNTKIDLDEQGKPVQVRQNLASGEVTIPVQRVLLYLHNQHRAPGIGISDMEPVWVGHWEKKSVRAEWRIFLRRAAQPWTLAHATDPHEDSLTSIATRVSSLLSGGVLGIGPQENVSTLDVAARAGDVFMQALEWIDRQSTAAVMAQFLDLGQSKVGSFALSRDHSDFFTIGRDGMLHEIASTLNDQLIRRAVLANWPSQDPDKIATFEFEPLAEADVTQLVALLGQIIAAPVLNPTVPSAFVDQLVQRVALTLGLDVEAIASATPQQTALLGLAGRAQALMQGASVPTPGTPGTPAPAAGNGRAPVG